MSFLQFQNLAGVSTGDAILPSCTQGSDKECQELLNPKACCAYTKLEDYPEEPQDPEVDFLNIYKSVGFPSVKGEEKYICLPSSNLTSLTGSSEN